MVQLQLQLSEVPLLMLVHSYKTNFKKKPNPYNKKKKIEDRCGKIIKMVPKTTPLTQRYNPAKAEQNQGKGIGGFQLLNSTKFLFTIDPLCSQNVSADW